MEGGGSLESFNSLKSSQVLFKFLFCHAFYGRFLSLCLSLHGHKTAATAPGTLSPEDMWKAGKRGQEPFVREEILFFLLHLIGQNCKTWVPLAAREAWDPSLWQREQCFHDRTGSISNATGSKKGPCGRWRMKMCWEGNFTDIKK